MKLRKPIWTEGLFITQHHLQQQDRYHESFTAHWFRSTLAYDFGLTELAVDERALEAGQFRVRQVAGILPNGLPFVCGERFQDGPPPRAVDTAFTPQMKSLAIHLGLPHETDNAANVDLEGSPMALTRLIADQTRTVDVNSGTNEHQVTCARPNLKVLIGNEAREAYDSIQIAELVRNPTGALVLRDTFVPPVFKIGASPFLMAGFRRVLTSMATRQRGLADSRRRRTAAVVDFAASDAAKFWMLNALNEAIPEVAHLLDQGTMHPDQAYIVLGRLIGRLCTFAVDGDPTTIPKFNYLNLGGTFEPMFVRALNLLDTIIAERYVQIPLQRREDGMHLGQIQDPTVLRYEFYLGVSGSMPEGEMRDVVPRLSKIASWQQISALLNGAVNGARLQLEFHPPGALPLRPGLVLFKVQKTPEYWSDIQGTGTIAIYHPPSPGATEFSLYAVDPQNL